MKKLIYILLVFVFAASTLQPIAYAATDAGNKKKDKTTLDLIRTGIYFQDIQKDCVDNITADVGNNTSKYDNVKPAPKTKEFEKFVKDTAAAAITIGKEYGIPPVAIIAQASIESGYGKSTLTTEAFNYFGIKADGNWKGPVWTGPTQEEVNGQMITIMADFRKYKNAEGGFKGYGEFIHKNSRYKKALTYPNDPVKYITELKIAGYATKGEYISINVSRQKTVIDYLNDLNISVGTNINVNNANDSTSTNLPDPKSKKTKVWKFFADKGLSSVQIAGIMGNLEAESSYSPDVTNTIGAYGIAQWLGGRKSKLNNYENLPKNKDRTKLEIQLNFMWEEELNRGYKASVLTPLKKSDSLAESVEIILKKYEIPCGENTCWAKEQKTRQDLAQKVLDSYGDAQSVDQVSESNGCNNTVTTIPNASTGYGYDINTSPGGMVYYSQTDPKWSNVVYSSQIPRNTSQTIGSSGCGITSISMVVETLTGKSFKPPESATWSVDKGFRTTDSGTDSRAFAAAAKKFNLSYSELGTSFKQVDEILKNKGLVIASVGVGTFTSKGHYLVIRKVDGDKYYLADPISEYGLTKGESNKKGYTKEQLMGAGSVNNMWGFTPYGGEI